MKKPKTRAWDAFSQWVRARDGLRTTGDVNRARCITCGNVYPTTELQAGHWIPRNKTGVFLDAHNVHAQCRGCNMYGRGRIAEHQRAIVLLYGGEELAVLTRLATAVVVGVDWGYWERLFEEWLIILERPGTRENPWREWVEGTCFKD